MKEIYFDLIYANKLPHYEIISSFSDMFELKSTQTREHSFELKCYSLELIVKNTSFVQG